MADDPLDSLTHEEKKRLAELVKGSTSRRDMLKAGGALSVGALLGGGGYAASTQNAKADASTSDADGNVGTTSNPVDVFADGVDVFDGANNQIGSLDETGLDTPSVSTDRQYLTEDVDVTATDSDLQSRVDKAGADGTVRLPRGGWTISTAVDLTGYDGLTLTAPRGARLVADSASPPTQLVTADNTDNVTLDGFTYDLGSEAATAIRAFNARGSTIKNFKILGDPSVSSRGIYLTGDRSNTVTYRHGNSVTNGWILGPDTGFEGDDKAAQYTTVTGIQFSDGGTTALDIKSIDNSTFAFNTITEYDNGVWVNGSDPSRNMIAFNQIAHGQHAIRLSAGDSRLNNVMFNHSTDMSSHQLYLEKIRVVQVRGNSTKNGASGAAHIKIEGADTLANMVENNLLAAGGNAQDNADYAIYEDSTVSNESAIRYNYCISDASYQFDVSTGNVKDNVRF